MSLIKLMSSDGQLLEVDERMAAQSETIRPRVQDYDGEPIPIPQVTGRILALVIDYLQKESQDIVGAGTVTDAGRVDGKWDTVFVTAMGQQTIFDLILAANYLDIKGLLDLTCQSVADMIKGKNPQEYRKTFKIRDDFTPED